MTPDRSNRNGMSGLMSTGTWAAILVAVAVIAVGTMYWNENRNNAASSNVGSPAQTTGSGGDSRRLAEPNSK